MVSHAERFLVAFNAIEQNLKEQLDLKRHFSFARMIEYGRKKHPLIEKHEVDLKKFSELRNVIVHERVSPGFIIAEPHMSIVEKIESIRDEITKPKRVFPNYEKNVRTLKTTDVLGTALSLVQRHRYSQFPVYDSGSFVGLLTNNGIANWFAHHAAKMNGSLNEVAISELLNFEKHVNNVLFVAKDVYLFEVKEMFIHHLEKKMTRLEAVLITETGRRNEKLLGIITPYDVIRLD